MTETPSELLLKWITRQIPDAPKSWYSGQLEKLANAPSKNTFEITFAMIPRKLGKDDLVLTPDELKSAHAARPGWNPSHWSLDVAARVYLLAECAKLLDTPFVELFKELHRTADLGELLALYAGLPLYREPEQLVAQITDGLRTNIKAEFEVIAHRNPFPFEQFEENPWNNMVLKALFIGVLLEPIQGLDERANPELARILRDYAHERWAADRVVSPELWRCIGPYAEGEYLEDFQRVIDQGVETERKAIALALKMAPESDDKKRLGDQVSTFDKAISSGDLTWRAIADEMLDNSLAVTRKLNYEVEMTR